MHQESLEESLPRVAKPAATRGGRVISSIQPRGSFNWLKMGGCLLLVASFVSTFLMLQYTTRHMVGVQQEYDAMQMRMLEFMHGGASNAGSANRTSSGPAFVPGEPSSPYAYAFVLGGIHPERPGYRGFYYNVLISTRALRLHYGSTADVWVLIQMASDTTATTLSDEEVSWAHAVGLHIHYLAKPCTSSFADLVFEKFRILTMTQYKRVLLLDGDILPLANMDYFFILSDLEQNKPETDDDAPWVKTWYPDTNETVNEPARLQPNVIYATRHEPCNAGLFLLTPEVGSHERLQQVIADQHEAAKDLPYPKFDKVQGWGHDFFAAGDQWDAILSSGQRWNYNAGHSDQGLLYYWGKYVEKSVSIIIADRVEHWIPDANATSGVRLEAIQYNALDPHTRPQPFAIQNSCNRHPTQWNCQVPYRDMAHFFGSTKPWEDAAKKYRRAAGSNGTHDRNQAYRWWYQLLEEMDTDLDMGLGPVSEWTDESGPPLGRLATWTDHAQMVADKASATASGTSECV